MKREWRVIYSAFPLRLFGSKPKAKIVRMVSASAGQNECIPYRLARTCEIVVRIGVSGSLSVISPVTVYCSADKGRKPFPRGVHQ